MRTVPLSIVLLSGLAAACGGDDDGGGAGDPDASASADDDAATDPDGAAGVLYPGPCRVDYDNDADDEIDSRYLYAYDAAGHKTLEEAVLPADDTVLVRWTYEFNADGQLVAGTYDSDVSTEVLDSRDTYTYDEDGNQTRIESKREDGDTIDSFTARTFDDMNRKTRIELDYDTAVAGLDRVITFDYQLDRFVEHNDQGDDDVIDDDFTYIHGDDDLIDREEYDRQSDDDIDEVYEHDYDGQGRVIEDADDGDNDGLFEYVVTYAYGSFGMTSQDVDVDGDGGVDDHEDYTYDDAGNLLLRELDSGLDDELDRRITYSYDCD